MVTKIKNLFSLLRNRRLVGIIILLLITAAIPLTIIVSQQQQEIRQRAAEITHVVLSEQEVSKIIGQNEQLLKNLGLKDSVYSLTESCPSVPLQGNLQKPNPQRAEEIASILSESTRGLSDAARAYPSAKGNQATQLKDQIQKFASQRKPLLIELMRENPDAALNYVFANNELKNIQNFSLALQNCVETQATVEGQLQILHADFFEDNVGVYQYNLITQDKKRIMLYPAKQKGRLFISGMKIKVNGYRIDDNIIFDESDPNQLEILPKSKSSSSSFIRQAQAHHDDYHTEIQQDARGEQKVVVLMVKFRGESDPSTTKEQVQDLIYNQMKNYYTENSYGKVTDISGDIYPSDGWYEMDEEICDPIRLETKAIEVADPDVNFLNYSRIIIVLPTLSCSFDGFGSVGKGALGAEGQILYMSTALITDNSLYVSTHEFGHNLGLYHANFLYCGSIPIKPTGCHNIEYGDIHDVMGARNENIAHMNAVSKDYLGWFDASNILTVTEAGDYSIEPIETATFGLKAIKIPRGDNDFLFVEYRQPIGFDIALKPDAFLGGLIHKTAAGIFLDGIPFFQESFILDTTPSPDAPDFDPTVRFVKNPTLLVGNSFTDYKADYTSAATISVRSISESSLIINVSFEILPPLPTPTPSPTPTPIPSSSSYNRVFVTSTKYNGNLGGVVGADTKCREKASAVGLDGNWKAWLSGSSNADSVAERFSHGEVPYVLLDGTIIANNWNDLTDGEIKHTINLNELLKQVSVPVWTNTNNEGSFVASPYTYTCGIWNSSDSLYTGMTGASYSVLDWTYIKGASGALCNGLFPLYCFEQPEVPSPTPTPSPSPTPIPSPTPTISNFCTPCRADIDKDGVVGSHDLSLQKTCLNKKSTEAIGGTTCAQLDLNKDGIINAVDTICVSKNFDIECPLNQKL